MKEKKCRYAKNYSGDCYECEGYYKGIVSCPFQYKDLNQDGSINVVECMKPFNPFEDTNEKVK